MIEYSVSICPECGARYDGSNDSCGARFETLLALDHSRREPWGSRHGQAFAAFALQHPDHFGASLDRSWIALYRIYRLNEQPAVVFASLRDPSYQVDARVPPRPAACVRPTVTIADLSDFAADTYAERLDHWCRASLAAWGAALDTP